MKINIQPSLLPLVVPIDSIAPYPGNPREGDVEAIRRSLRRFGQRKPVVVQAQSMTIVAGNHLWLAMKEEGMGEIAAAVDPISDEDAQAYLLADNRTAELGGYNEVDLAKVLEEVRSRGDLEGTGYTDRDVQRLLAQVEKNAGGPVRPELEFSEELMEEHQYVVLYFTNELDWKAAMEAFGIKPAKAWDATDSYLRAGLGRIVPGGDVLRRLRS